MNSKTTRMIALVVALSASAGLGCTRKKPFTVPDFEDPPVFATTIQGDLPIYSPGFGIVKSEGASPELQVAIERADGPLIHEGQPAKVYVPPSTSPLSGKVTRIIHSVNSETGQSIAWLRVSSGSTRFKVGDFVQVQIRAQLKPNALSVPREAVLIREGKNYVIRALRKGESPEIKEETPKIAFKSQEVEVGETSDQRVEIKSGLQAGDPVMIRGGLGFLFPEFKADSED